jgi:hypothetical protein
MLAVLLILCCSACTQQENVNVITHKPEMTVEHPAEIPLADMQKARGLTQWFFHCRPQIKYDSQVDQSGHATITVRGVTMEIGLSIQQLLPEKSAADVQAHEQGHADVCKRIYADAPAIARECSQELIGKQFSGDGQDTQKAISAAVSAATKSLCENYSSQTANRAQVLSGDFDRITMHGLAKITPSEAVDQVFQQESGHVTRSQKIR